MGGINAGFCDGHVMFMNEKESFDVLKAISTRNGGEKVDLP
jgi:prepilin-type processing-associated H-X9-DG protein